MLKRITSLMIFIAIVFGQQSKSGLELEESTIQGVLTVKLAKADSNVVQKLAIADSNVVQKLAIADSNVVQKLAIADAKEDFNSGLKWSALSMDSRLNTLYTKNEKHRSIYQTAYEKEIRKQRSKYSLLATSSCIVDLGVFLVVAGYIGAYMLISGIH